MAVGGEFLCATSASYKPFLESFVVVCLLSAAREIFVLWNVTCVVASRLLRGSNSQIFKETSRRRAGACFNVLNKGKCWVMSRRVLRIRGIWLSGEIVDRQMKHTSS